jgi:hypothetical protein
MIDVSSLVFDVTQNAMYPVLLSFIFGGISGFMCMQCVLPIVFYGAAEGSPRKGFTFALLFNLPRLLMFLTLGVIAALFTGIIQPIQSSSMLLGIEYLITGLVLILFSAELFGVMNLDKIIASRLINMLMPLLKRDLNTHSFGALVRGVMLSFACVLGSSLLVFGVGGMAVLSSDPLSAFLTVSAFGIGNIVFTTLSATVLGASTGFLKEKTRRNIPKYASIFGSMIILFIGLSYIIQGLYMTGLLG